MNKINIQGFFGKLFQRPVKTPNIPGSGMTDSAVGFDEARRYGAMVRSEADPTRRAELSKKQAEAFKAYADGLAVRDQ